MDDSVYRFSFNITDIYLKLDRYIYVYKDGKVSYNKVLLGRRMDDKYEIISGVSDGDQVVVAGQSRLTNGAEVSVENAE